MKILKFKLCYFNYLFKGVKNVQNQNSDVLREIAVPLTSDQECVSYNLQYDYQIDPTTQICAGSIGGNRTASENDSGIYF